MSELLNCAHKCHSPSGKSRQNVWGPVTQCSVPVSRADECSPGQIVLLKHFFPERDGKEEHRIWVVKWKAKAPRRGEYILEMGSSGNVFRMAPAFEGVSSVFTLVFFTKHFKTTG